MKLSEEEVYVGKDLGGREVEITESLVENYREGTGDDHPFYFERSPLGGPIAPALILFNEVFTHGGWYLPNIFGNLHAKQEWEILRPLPIGEQARTRCTVVDRYVRRDREIVVNEALVLDKAGR
ncbi:MAG: MaoC family dehydratase, partial [Vicinamibacteria bacterium]